MGLRELLMVILVAVLVSIALVVAINTINNASAESAKDQSRLYILDLAIQAQAWAMKPTFMGGGSGSFNGFTFGQIMAQSSTSHGDYAFQVLGPKELQIQGIPAGLADTLRYVVRLPNEIVTQGSVR
jgi:hypothetical protein